MMISSMYLPNLSHIARYPTPSGLRPPICDRIGRPVNAQSRRERWGEVQVPIIDQETQDGWHPHPSEKKKKRHSSTLTMID